MLKDWSLSKLPPEGHPDVGMFFWGLFEQSEREKERLNLKDRWLENHRLWRGGSVNKSFKNKYKVSANLIFSNVNRTVANLTAKNPNAEVIATDAGYVYDETGEIVVDEETGEPLKNDDDVRATSMLKSWWNDSEQNKSLVDSCLNMEIYGPTIEKAHYDAIKQRGAVTVVDPFAFVIAPGNWTDLNDAPYVGMAFPDRPDAIEAFYELEPGTISPDDTYSVLGEEREDNRPKITDQMHTGGVHSSAPVYSGDKTMYRRGGKDGDLEQALVVEIFVRDNSVVNVIGDDGLPNKQLKYPGGIRMVTVSNQGEKVLVDISNPNVNEELPRDRTSNTFLFDNFPYWKGDSYRDPSTMWPFAAAEQVGDLAEKIGELLSRMFRYLNRQMFPPLVLPQDTGLDERDINNEPGLILKPITGNSGAGIKFLAVPSLPSDTVRLYEMMLGMFDRTYQIEDADRGEAPNRVIAASAIAALQERNAVLMRHKIRQVDYMIRQRGRAALSFFQNFGLVTQEVKVADEIKQVKGIDLIDREFNYVVESGSTVTQTTQHLKEQAIDLYQQGAIDNRDLLEKLNWPGWREVIDRMSAQGGDIEAAAQVFVDAGIPEEHIQQMFAMLQQGGVAEGQEQ